MKSEKKKPFKASDGWLHGFQQRNRTTSRTVTSVGQKVPANAAELAKNFFKYVDDLRKKSNSKFIVWNCDQMPMYFDSPKNKSMDIRGNKTISVRTTGNEKNRFTVMLCADNTGRRLKPTVILKGLKKVPVNKIGKDLLNKVHVMTGTTIFWGLKY